MDTPRQIIPATPEDDSEFVTNLTAHQTVIQNYLNALLPGDSEIPDITQRANLVLWNKRAEFEAGSNFKAWALSIAYWEARAWMSKRKQKAWLFFDEELVKSITEHFVTESGGEDDLAFNKVNALRLCLADLSDSDRVIVVNHYQHEKSLAECGKILGRSRDSLKTSLYRIRHALRRCIESRLSLPHP